MLVLWAGLVRAESWDALYPEGPLWQGDTLYWAEMTAHKVMRRDGAGDPEAFFHRDGCGPTAIAPYGEGFLVLCHLEGALALVDAQGRLGRMIERDREGNRLRDPNDAFADAKGGVWFTDPGAFSILAPAEGAIYYLDADGSLSRHATGLRYGNGVFLDHTRNRLLVSENLARRVFSYPITEEGLGAPQVLIDLNALGLKAVPYAEAGPDGLEIARDGRLWIAEYGAGRFLVWDMAIGLVDVIETDAPYLTNIAFDRNGRAAITGTYDIRLRPLAGRVWIAPTSP